MANSKGWMMLVVAVGMVACTKPAPPVPQVAVLQQIQARSENPGPCELYTKFTQAQILHQEVMLDPLRLLPALGLSRMQLDEVKYNAAKQLVSLLTTKMRKKEFSTQRCEAAYVVPGETNGTVFMYMDSVDHLASSIQVVYNYAPLQGAEYATFEEIHQAHRQAAMAAAPKLLKAWADKKFERCEESLRLNWFVVGEEVYYKDLGMSSAQVVKLLDLYPQRKYAN